MLDVLIRIAYRLFSRSNNLGFPSHSYQPAAPFYQLNRGVRVIIFDTRNVLGESIGVLFAWVVLSMCTVTLITWLYRRRELRAYEKTQTETTEKQA